MLSSAVQYLREFPFASLLMRRALGYLPIWHNLTSTSSGRLEAILPPDIVLSFRHSLGVGSETEGILKLH